MTETSEQSVELSVVLPCLNEEKTLAHALEMASELIVSTGLCGELVVADNGSTDGSRAIAEAAGARVVAVPRKGYGFALLSGIRAARGRYIVMGDADATYDFREARVLVQALAGGADLAMGSRLRGTIEPGAMPPLHRHLGTPVLTWLIRCFFGLRITDCNCGLRAFTRAAFDRMDLVSGGMEFASEMLIKAAKADLTVKEFPVSLLRDTRDRPPHLKAWRDGWRHLRFILLFAPHIVFRLPGWILSLFFGAMVLRLSVGPATVLGRGFDYHHLFYAVPLFCMGYQLLWFATFEEYFLRFAGLAPSRNGRNRDRRFQLERWLMTGVAMVLLGVGVFVDIFATWWLAGRGELLAVRAGTLGLTAVMTGGLTLMNALMLSMLELRMEQRAVRSPEPTLPETSACSQGYNL